MGSLVEPISFRVSFLPRADYDKKTNFGAIVENLNLSDINGMFKPSIFEHY